MKETPKITDEVSNALNKLVGESLNLVTDFEGAGSILGSTDETFVKFLKHLKEQNIVYTDSQSALQGYQSYLQQTAKASAMATLRTKALSVAMKAVSAIGWTIALTAATNLIGKGIDALSDLANASDIAKGKADNFADSLSKAFGNMTKDTSTLSELNEEYQTLSEGVTRLGKNVGLSSDEYERYKTIVSQISDIMPDMTAKFNTQGEKIGFIKGNLADLNKEYENYARQQAILFMTNGDENGNTVQDILDDLSNTKEYGLFENIAKSFKNLFGIYDESDLPIATVLESYKDILGKGKTEIAQYLNDIELTESGNHTDLDQNRAKALVQHILGASPREIENMTGEEFNALQEKIYAQIQGLEYELAGKNSNLQTVLSKSLFASSDYWELSDEIKENINSFISSINYEIGNGLNLNSDLDITVFTNKLIKSFSDAKSYLTGNYDYIDIKNAWKELFNPDLKELPLSEYKSEIEKYLTPIFDMLNIDDEELKKQYTISLGFDFEVEGVLDGLIEKIVGTEPAQDIKQALYKAKIRDSLTEWTDTLNVGELELINSDAFIREIERTKNSLNGAIPSFEDYETALEKVSSAKQFTDSSAKITASVNSLKTQYDLLNAAINEQNESGYLSKETLDGLIESNIEYSELMDYKNGQYELNNELVKESIENTSNETYESLKLAIAQSQLRYYEIEQEINSLSSAESEYISQLQDEQNGILQNLDSYRMLENQLQSVTDKYAQWDAIQSKPESGENFDKSLDMIDAIQKGFETGKVGVETFKHSIATLIPDSVYKNLETTEQQLAAIEEYFDNTATRYLIKGEDADFDVSGIKNFLTDAINKDLVSGTWDNFEIKPNVKTEDFMRELNLTKEMVRSIFGEIKEYDWGNTIDFSDEEIKSTEDAYIELQRTINDIKTKLSELNDMGFAPDSQPVIDLTNQLNSAKESQDSLKNAAISTISAWSKQYLDLTSQIKEQQAVIDSINNSPLESGQIDTSKLDEEQQKLDELIAKKDTLSTPTQMEFSFAKDVIGDFDDIDEKIASITKGLENMGTRGLTGTDKFNELSNQLDMLKSLKEMDFDFNATLNTSDLEEKSNSAKDKVDEVTDAVVDLDNTKATLHVNKSQADSAISSLQTVSSWIDRLNTKSATVTVNYKEGAKPDTSGATGTGSYNGSANAFGTTDVFNTVNSPVMDLWNNYRHDTGAYAAGDWGIPNNQTSLVNELGNELLVRDGQWYLIEGGAQFLKLKKNDIIFNHKQTEELFRNGNVTSDGGRGKMKGSSFALGSLLAKGKAMVSGGFQFYKSNTKYSAKENTKYNQSAAKETSKASKAVEDTAKLVEKLFDWIEIKLERLSQATEDLFKKAETAITQSIKKTYYNKAISSTKKEIQYQGKAYNRYMAQANKVGLSSSYKKKVQNGTIDIQSITDEDLKEKIEAYQEFYEKAQNCNSKIGELLEQMQEYAEAMYNLPLEFAAKSIEKAENTIDELEAKYKNATTASIKNSLLDKQTTQEKKIKDANAKAAKDTKSNLKKAQKDVDKSLNSDLKSAKKDAKKSLGKKLKYNKDGTISTKGLSSKQKEKADYYNSLLKGKKARKSGKEIDTTGLTGAALQNAIKYNEALKAQQEAQHEASISAEEYTTALRENAKEKLDNIKEEYEAKESYNNSVISKSEKSNALKEAKGRKLNASDYNSVINSAKSNVTNTKAELDAYKKQYEKNLKDGIYKGDAQAQREALTELQNLEAAWYEAQTAVEDYIETQKQIEIDNINDLISSLEKVSSQYKDLLSLRKAQGLDTTDDEILTQISNNNAELQQQALLLQKYQNLLNEAKANGADADILKYQNLINDTKSSILDLQIANEELNDSIYDIRINALNKEKEALQKLNDQEDRRLKIEDAKETVEKAKQRTDLVYDGKQFVYKRNEQAYKDAVDALRDIEFEELINTIEDNIDALDELKNSYNLYDKNGNTLNQNSIIKAVTESADKIFNSVQAVIASSNYSGDRDNGKLGNTIITEYGLITPLTGKRLYMEYENISSEALKGLDLQNNLNTGMDNLIFDAATFKNPNIVMPNNYNTVNETTNSVNIGDIYVSGIDNAEQLAREIESKLPNEIIKRIYNV